MLNKLGFNRHTPHAVVFGPCRYGGLSLRDLTVKQGIAITENIFRHIRSNSPQGRQHLIALSWWQADIGTSYSLLEFPQTVFRYDTPHIYSTLRTFLATINGSIHIADLLPQLPLPLRQRDRCLMEVINDIPNIS